MHDADIRHVAITEAERFWQPDPEPPPRRKFTVTNLRDVEIGGDPPWLVDRLWPASGLAVVVGLPKCGKSFLVTDAAFHIAMGRTWAGRKVQPGAVAYVTSEGLSGFRRRLVAFREHYDAADIPFGHIAAMPDLGHGPADAEAIIADVREWSATLGDVPIRAIVIDTLARAMKGADENTAKDMSALVENCERIGAAFSCLVIVVHHAGRMAEARARGSNVLDGAADAMWGLEKSDGVTKATIIAMKDGEDGIAWSFRLVPYGFGDVSETTTCTVEILSEPSPAKPAETSRNQCLGDVTARLLAIVQDAIADLGKVVPGLPHGGIAVTRADLKSFAQTKGWLDAEQKPDSARAQFNKTLNVLANRKLIGLTAEHVWSIRN